MDFILNQRCLMAQRCTDTTHNTSITAGQTVDLQIVSSSGAAATVMNWTTPFTTP